jgi:ketosteroid isomerase-like protein
MDALGRRDLSRLIAFADPEVEWRSFFATLGEDGVYRGHEGMRQLFQSFADVLDEPWYSPEEFFDVGDEVVVVLRWGGRGKGSGVEIEEREEAWIFTVQGGKIRHVMEFPSRRQALEAAGLQE